VGESQGVLYMAMVLVSGETLATVARELRERGERLSDEALLAVGIHTCAALEAVHALKLVGEGHLNLVHRDVSPHNLLLASSGALKLIDFGIAKAATNRNLTSPGVTKGKAGYFSPEQAMGRSLDGRSDLFSLGVTLYKLAHGSTPFDQHKTHQARNNALVYGRWEKLSNVCPGLPAGFYEVVDRALMLRPGDRFNDAREMREALERVALESGVHVGAGSLAGYVESDGDEVSVSAVRKIASSGGGSMRPVPGPRPGALPRRHTEKVIRASDTVPSSKGKLTEKLKRNRLRVAAGATAMLVVALLGTALLLSSHPASAGRPQPLPGTPTASQFPPHAAGELAESAPEDEETVTARQSELVVMPMPADIMHKSGPAPVEAPKRVRPMLAARAPNPETGKPQVTVSIGAGEGQLRVAAEPNGEVMVGNEKWGDTPVSRHIPAGRYSVTILSGKSRGTCEVTVLPDSVARFKYDFGQKKCIAF
ncbi:MAG: serine/threonine protein kinase, partial [Myxococcaceae bacterium]